jgi:hypothetical protein
MIPEHICSEIGKLQASNGNIATLGYAGHSDLKALIDHGHIDTLLTSAEGGLGPLPGELIESELKIPKREIKHWVDECRTNPRVTLAALPSRRSGFPLKGVILMPFGTSESYKALVEPQYRKLPCHDFYYNVTFEAIFYAVRRWQSRRIGTNHLSGCGQDFHIDIPLNQCEAVLHSLQSDTESIEHFCFLGCCIREELFADFDKRLAVLNGEHRAIAVQSLELEHGVCVLTLDWSHSSGTGESR